MLRRERRCVDRLRVGGRADELRLVVRPLRDRLLRARGRRCRERDGEGQRYSMAMFLYESPSNDLGPEEATTKRDAARRRRAQKSTA